MSQQEGPPQNTDPNVMPDGQHPPGVDESTGLQSDYLGLIGSQAQRWGAEAAIIELPHIEADGARTQEDPHY